MILRSLLCLALTGSVLAQYEARRNPDQDNTLYFDDQGSVSNGVGELLFAGISGTGQPRAAVLRFDVEGLPEGAIVTDVQLRLVVSQLSPFAKDGTLGVHRLLYSWGEGTSNAVSDPGKGAPATDGDATWLHRYYPVKLWAQAGGDFDPTPSAEARTGTQTGPILWSSPQLIADVQAWVDRTRPNNGWVIRATEPLPKWTARGFDSRESVSPKARPRLTLTYDLPCDEAVACADGNVGTILLASCDCAGSTAEVVLEDAAPGVFALLLTGQSTGVIVDPPGATGELCLGGGQIGRFHLDVGATDASGRFAVNVLDAVTAGGGGRVPTLGGFFCVPPGSTYRFQYLHGTAGGSFSPALDVTFH